MARYRATATPLPAPQSNGLDVSPIIEAFTRGAAGLTQLAVAKRETEAARARQAQLDAAAESDRQFQRQRIQQQDQIAAADRAEKARRTAAQDALAAKQAAEKKRVEQAKLEADGIFMTPDIELPAIESQVIGAMTGNASLQPARTIPGMTTVDPTRSVKYIEGERKHQQAKELEGIRTQGRIEARRIGGSTRETPEAKQTRERAAWIRNRASKLADPSRKSAALPLNEATRRATQEYDASSGSTPAAAPATPAQPAPASSLRPTTGNAEGASTAAVFRSHADAAEHALRMIQSGKGTLEQALGARDLAPEVKAILQQRLGRGAGASGVAR